MDPASANSGPLVAQPAQGPAGTAQQNKKPKRKVLTSLALQIFIYFGAWWDVFYYIVNILVFVYKGTCTGTYGCVWAGGVHALLLRSSLAPRNALYLHDAAGCCSPALVAKSTAAACTPMHMVQGSTCPTPKTTSPWSSRSLGSGSSLKSRACSWVRVRIGQQVGGWAREFRSSPKLAVSACNCSLANLMLRACPPPRQKMV